uniref:GG12089 n=1 Tax=Drosophila erecta TaxID=7220 RepID=B3P253_DROER
MAVGLSNDTSAPTAVEERKAFSKGSKVQRTPPLNQSDNTPKRPLELTSPPTRVQPAKRIKTPQLEIAEMGAILDDLLTKVNHNGVRSINLAMKNAFARLKELHLRLRIRLPETESVQSERTSMVDTSQQTSPQGPPSSQEPSASKAGSRSDDRTARSALKTQRLTQRKPADPQRRPRAPFYAIVACKMPQSRLQQRPTESRRKRLPRERPDALIITPTAGLPDARLRAIGESVTRVKRKAKGELLLELCASSQDRTHKLRVDMGAVLGDRASLRTVTQSKVFLIRDLDELT